MNLFERFIYLLQSWKFAETPGNYGWFHFMWIGIIAVVTVLLCVFFRNADDKTFRRLCLITGVIMIAFEALKQVDFSMSFRDGVCVWDYQWYAFPYQFCSAPMFILPLVAFLKDGRVRDSLMGFMCFYVLFAGIAVFCYPSSCYVSEIFISCQSMEHHGLQVAMGVFMVVYNRKRLSFKCFFNSIPSFFAFTAVAMVLNELAPLITTETFNMYYISPHFPSTLALLSSLYNDVQNPNVPWGIFILLYFIGFTFAALLAFLAEKGLVMLFDRKRKA